MNRLRVRVELNRRKTGVPLEELVSVVDETRKFFHLLAEDVEIPVDRGEWQASNFDPESLNFTAEYNGPASSEQIRAFSSAFGGATSLRRETIAQFTHIADFIEEDELVGFGLYQSDQESEPSDWRCLSKRDALRFADEIRLLAKATGESGPGAAMPSVMNGSVGGRRLFKDRREREALAIDPSKGIREVESSLSNRIGLLEREVESHSHKMNGLGTSQEVADERFLKLLGAMESFWSHAPRQLPPGSPETSTQPAGERPLTAAGPLLQPQKPRRRKWGWAVAAGLIIAAMGALGVAGQWSRLSGVIQLPKISNPALATSIPPAAGYSNTQLVRTTTPSEPQGSDPQRTPGRKTVSPALAPTPAQAPAEDAPKIQIARSRSESVNSSPRRDAGAELTHQVSLEVPTDLKELVKEQVQINVTVDIDQRGKVTAAEIASTKGQEAALLTTEALKAARWFRFRPTKRANQAGVTQTVLTFVFDPDPTLPDISESKLPLSP